jgi:hypothetical protein
MISSTGLRIVLFVGLAYFNYVLVVFYRDLKQNPLKYEAERRNGGNTAWGPTGTSGAAYPPSSSNQAYPPQGEMIPLPEYTPPYEERKDPARFQHQQQQQQNLWSDVPLSNSMGTTSEVHSSESTVIALGEQPPQNQPPAYPLPSQPQAPLHREEQQDQRGYQFPQGPLPTERPPRY